MCLNNTKFCCIKNYTSKIQGKECVCMCVCVGVCVCMCILRMLAQGRKRDINYQYGGSYRGFVFDVQV